MVLFAGSWFFAAWCVLWIYPTRETRALHDFDENAALKPLGLDKIQGKGKSQLYFFNRLARMTSLSEKDKPRNARPSFMFEQGEK